MIEGVCLCGAVQIAATRKPRTVTECNCSVCRRYGTLWAYYRRKQVTITAPRGGIESFQRRPRGLRFTRCTECGCIVSWEYKRGPEARMALNARLFDHVAMADVSISVLDGDKTWRVLEKGARPGSFISPKKTPPTR